MTYAKGTGVSVERSRAELGTILARYGAKNYVVGSDDDAGVAHIGFALEGHRVRLSIPLPKFDDFATHLDRVRRRTERSTPERQRKDFEQACRERWRAAVLMTKSKLELVQLGCSTFEREFLADVVLPDGRTVHEALREPLRVAGITGQIPRYLLGPAEPPRVGPGAWSEGVIEP